MSEGVKVCATVQSKGKRCYRAHSIRPTWRTTANISAIRDVLPPRVLRDLVRKVIERHISPAQTLARRGGRRLRTRTAPRFAAADAVGSGRFRMRARERLPNRRLSESFSVECALEFGRRRKHHASDKRS